MNYNVLFLLAELPTPIIIMAVSALMWKNPPKQTENFGYRTKRSQKSESAWNYAQITFGRICTICFVVFTALTVALQIVAISVNFGNDTAFGIFLAHTAALVILLFAVIAAVESKLKKHFDEDGNLRENGTIN